MISSSAVRCRRTRVTVFSGSSDPPSPSSPVRRRRRRRREVPSPPESSPDPESSPARSSEDSSVVGLVVALVVLVVALAGLAAAAAAATTATTSAALAALGLAVVGLAVRLPTGVVSGLLGGVVAGRLLRGGLLGRRLLRGRLLGGGLLRRLPPSSVPRRSRPSSLGRLGVSAGPAGWPCGSGGRAPWSARVPGRAAPGRARSAPRRRLGDRLGGRLGRRPAWRPTSWWRPSWPAPSWRRPSWRPTSSPAPRRRPRGRAGRWPVGAGSATFLAVFLAGAFLAAVRFAVVFFATGAVAASVEADAAAVSEPTWFSSGMLCVLLSPGARSPRACPTPSTRELRAVAQSLRVAATLSAVRHWRRVPSPAAVARPEP